VPGDLASGAAAAPSVPASFHPWSLQRDGAGGIVLAGAGRVRRMSKAGGAIATVAGSVLWLRTQRCRPRAGFNRRQCCRMWAAWRRTSAARSGTSSWAAHRLDPAAYAAAAVAEVGGRRAKPAPSQRPACPPMRRLQAGRLHLPGGVPRGGVVRKRWSPGGT
jgi:hypothetical protein